MLDEDPKPFKRLRPDEMFNTCPREGVDNPIRIHKKNCFFGCRPEGIKDQERLERDDFAREQAQRHFEKYGKICNNCPNHHSLRAYLPIVGDSTWPEAGPQQPPQTRKLRLRRQRPLG